MTSKDVTSRPNYFAGQYLLAEDFQLEQQYHIDRLRRHTRLLHVSGIVQGFKIKTVDAKDLTIEVEAGTAIDSLGRQIIQSSEKEVELTQLNGGDILCVGYKEERTENQEVESNTERRVQEVPEYKLIQSPPPNFVPLAKLQIINNTITIDESVRVYSGIKLPGAGGQEITLRFNEEKKSAIFSGKLTVEGDTQLNSKLTVNGDTSVQKLTVNGVSTLTGAVSATNGLTVGGVTNLTKVSDTGGQPTYATVIANNGMTVGVATTLNSSLTVKGDTSLNKLTVNGASTLTGAVTATNGLTVGGVTNLTQLSVTNGQPTYATVIANNGMTVGVATTLKSSLTVNGDTSLNKLTVNGASTLTGAVTATNGLTVGALGDPVLTVASNLVKVEAATIINKHLTVNPDGKNCVFRVEENEVRVLSDTDKEQKMYVGNAGEIEMNQQGEIRVKNLYVKEGIWIYGWKPEEEIVLVRTNGQLIPRSEGGVRFSVDAASSRHQFAKATEKMRVKGNSVTEVAYEMNDQRGTVYRVEFPPLSGQVSVRIEETEQELTKDIKVMNSEFITGQRPHQIRGTYATMTVYVEVQIETQGWVKL